VTVKCAVCGSYVCRGGIRDAGPDFCPMHGEFPTFQDLYRKGPSVALLRNSALVEARGYGRWTRLREVGELSLLMGFRRVGLAHGPGTLKEATSAASYLSSMGLDPVLPPPGEAGDPPLQAEWFRRSETEMNVVVGLGVAAEALFVKSSHVPTVVLLARDLRLRHNPAAALYLSRSYLQDALHGHWPPSDLANTPDDPELVLHRMVREEGSEGSVPPPTRLEEAMSVAQGLGASTIGITFCVGFKEEARTLTRILEINGFQVVSACCKTGATPKEEIGIRDEEKIRPGRPEMTCNPLAQAELLNREEVHFALVLGQCVGHDAATLGHLDAPAACLVAKDRVLGHNPVAALV